MFHLPSDVMADHSFNVPTNNEHDSLNLIQVEHPDPIPPSPENTPSSSPASMSCSTISSLKTWQSTSEQLQTPIFSFPDPVCRNFEAITANSSDELSSQRTSCSQMSAFDVPSTQEPAISAIDEGELEDLRWTTGVPCHMIDVFRANPFTAMDQPRIPGTNPPSLDNSTNPDSAECKVGDSHHSRSAAKHILSPDAVEQKRKARTKRARIQSSPVVPFPATGPLEMFAYEFRLDIPYQDTGFSRVEGYRRCGDLSRSYPLSRDMDGHEHLLAPRPVVAYGSEDVSLRSPVDREDVGLTLLPPRLPYSSSHTASVSQKARPENSMQPSHLFPPSVPLLTQVPLRLEDPSNPAVPVPPQGIGARPRFEEYGRSDLPPAMPVRVIPERAHTFRPAIAPAAPSIQKPLYACPLCPRDFQLPNGLALHLKWHDRVGRLETNLTSHMNHRPQDRVPPKNPRTELRLLEARDVRHPQLPTRDNLQRNTTAGFPTAPYTAPQRASSAQVEYMTMSGHEQYYTTSALSYERQPQECALFHDALQLDLNSGFSFDDDTYLAPLDGLSVLQPLPFEQSHLSSGQLCSLPPS